MMRFIYPYPFCCFLICAPLAAGVRPPIPVLTQEGDLDLGISAVPKTQTPHPSRDHEGWGASDAEKDKTPVGKECQRLISRRRGALLEPA
jgi:hypothetical protein